MLLFFVVGEERSRCRVVESESSGILAGPDPRQIVSGLAVRGQSLEVGGPVGRGLSESERVVFLDDDFAAQRSSPPHF